VRQVDSSLLDEWEQLINPVAALDAPVVPPPPPSVVTNTRAFRVLVRNELFRRVQLAALDDIPGLAELDPDFDWDAALESYYAAHDSIGTDADARSSAMLIVEEGAFQWSVQQILADPAGDHDWRISATVDLAESAERGLAVVRVTALAPL